MQTGNSRTWYDGQEVLLGPGKLEALSAVLTDIGTQAVLVVADSGAFELSGSGTVIANALTHLKWDRFSDFAPYFDLQAVARGVRSLETVKADLIMAVGGGTAMDMAKLIKWFGGWPASQIVPGLLGRSMDAEHDALRIPLIAIPTTAGSGSEATHFAVLYEANQKYSIAHHALRPNTCIVDAQLLASLPRGQRIAPGLDALGQSIESFWAVGATSTSQHLAREAMQLAWNYLPGFVSNPTGENAQGMARAAHLAGQAINLSKTTACHALSYAMSLEYGVPHGIAVALTLGPMMVNNANVKKAQLADRRGVDYVQQSVFEIARVLGFSDVREAASGLAQYVSRLTGIKSLSDVGITTRSQCDHLAAQVNLERLGNNPRKLSRTEISDLLYTITAPYPASGPGDLKFS